MDATVATSSPLALQAAPSSTPHSNRGRAPASFEAATAAAADAIAARSGAASTGKGVGAGMGERERGQGGVGEHLGSRDAMRAGGVAAGASSVADLLAQLKSEASAADAAPHLWKPKMTLRGHLVRCYGFV